MVTCDLKKRINGFWVKYYGTLSIYSMTIYPINFLNSN